jgi:lysophospholipase L1-like esterase
VRETQCLHLDLFQDARNNPLGEGPRRFYAEDGLHPSGEGYGIWFKELEKSLRTVV